MFKKLACCVGGVEHNSFDGVAVGGMDKRVKAHYLMPSRLSPLYVTSPHRSVCRLEKEGFTGKKNEIRDSSRFGSSVDIWLQ